MTSRPTAVSLTLPTSDGLALEAEMAAPDQPVYTAVVAHPHPLYGGNMYNNVVDSLFAHLPSVGVACLRFNFRGVGGSEGEHGEGRTEPMDIVAAIDELATRFPSLPPMVAGYSFGADVALSVNDSRIAGWFAVAPPLRVVAVEDMAAGADPRPKTIITGSSDEFRPPDQARELVAGWNNCTVETAEGAGHFFSIGLDAVTEAANTFITARLD